MPDSFNGPFMSQKVQLRVRGSGLYRIKLCPFSTEMSQNECYDTKRHGVTFNIE